jgi:inner membrane protein
MILLFLRALVNKIKPVLLIGALLAFLYVFIYVLLTLNDYAYLAGNIGLFVLLAVTMGFSIKLRAFRSQQD